MFACVCACLNKILLFLFSSVQDVSKRKEYTVPLPSNADNEALCTEQRQLMGKLENKCRKRLRITVMIYFFCWKVNMKSKATLFDFLRKDKGIYCMDAIRGKILKFKYLNIKCFLCIKYSFLNKGILYTYFFISFLLEQISCFNKMKNIWINLVYFCLFICLFVCLLILTKLRIFVYLIVFLFIFWTKEYLNQFHCLFYLTNLDCINSIARSHSLSIFIFIFQLCWLVAEKKQRYLLHS